MSAFTRALGVIHADPNLGEDAVYLPGDGSRVPCRAVRYQPDPVTDMGQHHVRQKGWVFEVQISQVALPVKGANLEMGVGREPWAAMPWDGLRKITDVQMDDMMLCHRVSVQ